AVSVAGNCCRKSFQNRRGDTHGPGFQCVSLSVLCSFFCSVVRGCFSCGRIVFRCCYMRYYMSLSSLNGGMRCYFLSCDVATEKQSSKRKGMQQKTSMSSCSGT